MTSKALRSTAIASPEPRALVVATGRATWPAVRLALRINSRSPRHGRFLPLLTGLCLGLLPGLIPPGPARAASPDTVRITILHTNDTHGHLIPFSYPDPAEGEAAPDGPPVTRDIGGMARIASLVHSIEAEPGHGTLLLDAGDILDGTPFSVVYRGKAEVAVQNAIGYDAMTAGNHEFNLTPEEFDTLRTLFAFPFLSANVRRRSDGGPVLRERIILERAGIKVGIFGLTTLSASGYPACRNRYQIVNTVSTARRQAELLREEGADLIVALTHIGYREDCVLADSVPAIDVIVGGHSHTRLAEPRVVPHAGKKGLGATLVVQAYQWGGELGRLDLALVQGPEGRWIPVRARGRLLPVTAEIAPDPAVTRLIDSLLVPMRPVYDVVVGEAEADFPNAGFERPTVNLVADAMREAAGAEVALQNYGGVRAPLFRGPVKVWDLASMLPFGNKIVVLEMTGGRLLQGLADERETLGASGLRAVFRGRKPVKVEVAGAPLDSARTYSVATVDFVARTCFPDLEPVRSLDLLLRDAVIDHIRARGRIAPTLDGRRRRLEG